MPYSIETEDGIIIEGIPDDIQPDAQVLKDRVAQERAKAGLTAPEVVPQEPTVTAAMTEEALALTPIPQEKPEEERTAGEVATGAGETALALGTGALGGTIGTVAGTLKGIAQSIKEGKFGTQEGARMIEQAAEDLVSSLTYTPRTEAGQEYTQAAAEALAPLEALGPLGVEIEAAARGLKTAAPAVRKGAAVKEAVKQAEQAGITPLTSDILPPKTFAGKLTQAAGERIPVVGTGPLRAAQQEQRLGAIKSFMSEQGAIGSQHIIDDVMKSLSTDRANKINKFSKIKSEVFAKMPDKKVKVDNAIKTIDSEISRLKEMKTEAVNPLIKVLDDYRSAFQDQNIENIEALRKQLGDQLDSPDFVSVATESGKSSKKIYGALNEDIGLFVKENGEPKDFSKWKVANKALSSTFSELQNNTLKSVLKKGEQSPEAVKSLLFSQRPSDIKLLYRTLGKDGRANARAAILHEALEKAGGIDDFTPEKFSTQLKRLQKSTGIFFTGDDRKALNGLSKALKLTKQAAVAGVKPPTGAELTAFATPTALTWFLGNDPVTGLAATAGIGGVARLYESKPVRNMLIKLSNAPKAKEMPISMQLMSIIQSQQEKEE